MYWILWKFDINCLYTCLPHLYTEATFPWEIQKVIFQRYYSYILQVIYVISKENKLIPPYPPHLKNVTALTCKTQLFQLTEGSVAFVKTLVALETAGCGLALVALKRTCRDVWPLECQASNVTASVQSGHLLQRYMLPVFFAIDQLHRPPRCAEIQPMSQQDASATCPHRGLVLDTRALAAVKLGCTNLIFVEPGAKINGQYHRDVLLMQRLLPAICSIAGDMFVFQEDNVPAHRTRNTVELLRSETPQFISPDICGQPTVLTSTR